VTGSIITTLGITGPINATNGVISSSAQLTSLNSYTSSNDSVLARILQTTTSLNTYTSSNDSIVSKVLQTTASLNTITGSLIGITNGLMDYTSSLKLVGLVSGSLIASSSYSVVSDNARSMLLYSLTQDFESYLLFSNAVAVNSATLAGNNNIRYNSSTNTLRVGTVSATKYLGGVVSGSAQLTELNTYTGSNDSVISAILQTTASLNTYTASNDSVRNNVLQTTASLNTYTGSNDNVISRILQTTASLNLKTGSYAVTGSNLFIGDQTITGSLAIKDSETDFLIEGNAFSQTYLTSNGAIVLNPGFGGVEMVGSFRTFKATDITADGTLIVKGSTTLGDTNVDSTIITGSLNVSGSTNLTGSVTINESRIDNGWTAYTPQWTAASVNPAIGNGTIEGWYKVVGKTCFVRGNIAMGSTTTFGSGEWYVSMPFTASHADAILMSATLLDNGSAWYNATMNGARAGFNHKSAIQYQVVGGTADSITPTGPFTWTNGDRFIWNGSYEIA
jgi:hypothetical protein